MATDKFRKLKKKQKRWKIEIPFKQQLNEKSENRLSKILSIKNDSQFDVYRGKADSNDINDIIEDIKSINDATVCINNITAYLNHQTTETDRITEQLNIYINQGLNDSNTEVTTLYKTLGKSMNLTAKRSETEIELFSQLYSEGINAFEKIIIIMNTFNLKFEDLGADIDAVKMFHIK
nr:hypothetical protein [Flavobacterium johnsoniae]